jgi:hypothetical protein
MSAITLPAVDPELYPRLVERPPHINQGLSFATNELIAKLARRGSYSSLQVEPSGNWTLVDTGSYATIQVGFFVKRPQGEPFLIEHPGDSDIKFTESMWPLTLESYAGMLSLWDTAPPDAPETVGDAKVMMKVGLEPPSEPPSEGW